MCFGVARTTFPGTKKDRSGKMGQKTKKIQTIAPVKINFQFLKCCFHDKICYCFYDTLGFLEIVNSEIGLAVKWFFENFLKNEQFYNKNTGNKLQFFLKI